MKLISFIISAMILFSCSSKKEEIKDEKFDHRKWMVAEEYTYPYRNSMIKDLLADNKIKKLRQPEIIRMLGTPTRTDNGHLFYKISQTRFGSWPISTKTLVIKLKPDSTVEWVKIHG